MVWLPSEPIQVRPLSVTCPALSQIDRHDLTDGEQRQLEI